MANLVAVEGDPFAAPPPAPVPVEGNPFEQAAPAEKAPTINVPNTEGSDHVDPVDHAEMSERIAQGSLTSRLWDTFSHIIKEGGMTDVPLGIEQGGETDAFLTRYGVFRDPKQARFGDTIRLANEVAIKPVAALYDLVGRVFNAGTFAGGEIGAKVEEMLGGSQGDIERARRDAKGILDMALLVGGAEAPSPFVRVRKGADGRVMDDPIGGPPKQPDFEAAAAGVRQAAEAPRVADTPEANVLKAADAPAAAQGKTGEINTGHERPFANANPITKEGSLNRIASGEMDLPTADALTKAHLDIQKAEKEDLAEAFNGDHRKADEFSRLLNADHLSPHGEARLSELRKEAKDVPERVYEDREQFRELAPTFRDLEKNPHEADHIINRFLSDLPPGDKPSTTWTSRQSVAMAVVRKAVQEAVGAGENVAAFTAKVLDRYTRTFPDPQDAAFMAGALKDALQRKRQIEVDPAATTEKVRALYEEHGIHPAEIAADVRADPTLAKDLASGSPMLPEKYTGFDPIKAAREQMEETLRANEGKTERPAGVSADLDMALQQRMTWPEMPKAASGETVSERVSFGTHISKIIDRIGFGNAARDVFRDAQMKVSPMAVGDATIEARATAKDFANAMRLVQWDHIRLHEMLTTSFDHVALKRMWDAADADTVAMIKGEKPTAVAALSDAERYSVDTMLAHAAQAWDEAKNVGLIAEEHMGLPGYAAPRVVVSQMAKGDFGGSTPSVPWRVGTNLRDRAANLRTRKHLTAEETLAAAQKSLGDDAQLVRDIRTLPMVTARLQSAIAGRKLINSIRAMADLQDVNTLGTVMEGVPKGMEKHFFTIDHPAFKTLRPRFEMDKVTGKYHVVLKADGTPVMDNVPIYVRNDFEGPLRAVLAQTNGAIYKGFIGLKSKSMSLIMFSPALHNMVIYGRALPAVNGNFVKLGKLYFDGAKIKANPEIMRQAISDGMVPFVRQHGQLQDAAGLLPSPTLNAGRSITAKVARAIPDLFNPHAGDKVGRAIDKAGDFWHNTLLWDRIGDLQAGLYAKFREDKIAAGFDPVTAGRMAAHYANRYSGAIPVEAMSSMARKTSNVVFFSRSYTLGQLGTFKDMLTGMPRDVLAQIDRDAGLQAMTQIQSAARRKAIALVAVDVALFYAGTSLLQSASNVLLGDKSLDDEARGYMERFKQWLDHPGANPFSAFGMLKDVPAQHENEPRAQDRVLAGYQDDGTAYYMRNPFGKAGEEFAGWVGHPLSMMERKMSPMLKPLTEVYNNQDFAGRHIYDPYPETSDAVLKAIGTSVWHFMKAQVPSDALEGLSHLVSPKEGATDDDKFVNVLKLAGPFMGFTFSKGAPGGPAVGEYFRWKEKHDFEVQQVLPEARDLIKAGDVNGAIEMMAKVNIPPSLIRFYVTTTQDPRSRTARRAFGQFLNTLDPDDRRRVDFMLKRNEKPQEKQDPE